MPSIGDIFSVLASVGMAVGPPLVYVDQAVSMIRKKDSTGFSHDVCGVLLIANIIRIFFWLGNRFETPLLVQSILLIVSQLLLLSICLHYRPVPPSLAADYAPLSPIFDAPSEGPLEPSDPAAAYESRSHRPHSPAHARPGTGGNEDADNSSAFLTRPPHDSRTWRSAGGMKSWFGGGVRPFDFWQWERLGQYLEFLAGMIIVLAVAQLIFGRWMWYIDALGFIALTIESTLPIPQFISNYKRKSCYGFRSSTLAGWLFGDTFKTGYFFIRNAPVQFKVTAIMTVCWDVAVLAQRVIYKAEPPISVRAERDDAESRGLNIGG